MPWKLMIGAEMELALGAAAARPAGTRGSAADGAIGAGVAAAFGRAAADGQRWPCETGPTVRGSRGGWGRWASSRSGGLTEGTDVRTATTPPPGPGGADGLGAGAGPCASAVRPAGAGRAES